MIPVRRLLSIFLPVLLLSGSISVALSQTANVQKQVTATPGTASSTDARSVALQRLRQQERMRAALSRLPVKRQATANVAGGSGGIIETIAGSAPFQAPINALKAGLGQTQGVVEDAHGNIFVSTGDLRTVLKIDTAGNVTVYAGKALPPGPAQAGGDGGLATAATLVYPMGLAMDAAGNLYIADSGSDTVRLVNSNGTISTIAGISDSPGHTGDGGPATSAQLRAPQSLALDGSGNLFIMEASVVPQEAFVREVNLSSGIINTFAGNGNPTCLLVFSPSCPATSMSLGLGYTGSGLAYFQGTLFVFDNSYSAMSYPAILSISVATGTAQKIAGGGQSSFGGYAEDVLLYGSSIAVDGAGNIFVTDDAGILELAVNQVISDPANGPALIPYAGMPISGFSGDGGPAIDAYLEAPGAMTITPSGNLLFADQWRLRSISPAGIINTVAGRGSADYFGDGGAALMAGLDYPTDIAVDSQGNVFVADADNFVVRKVDASTSTITTIAGTGSWSGYTGESTPTAPGDGGPATDSALGSPSSIVIDSASHLYLGSIDQGIRLVDLGTGLISTLNGSLEILAGMVFDGKQTIYAVNAALTIVAVDTKTGVSTVIAGRTFQGTQGNGDGGPALQAYFFAKGIALDGSGNLYLSDLYTHSIRVINLATGIIETFAGSAGNYGNAGDGGLASAASFENPTGLRYDGAGHLLIVDTAADVIREVDLTTNIITTVVGSGEAGYTGDGGVGPDADLNGPSAVALDTMGDLYIADALNDRVRRVVLHPAMLAAALSASSTSFTAGTNVTFTATFTGTGLGIAPTGAVTFFDGTTSIGTGILEAGASGAYVATLTNSTLAAGAHNITAQFAGDGNYAAVTSPAVTVTVVAAIPPSFTVTAAPASITVAQGASGTAVFTVTPAGGFNQAVTFSCGSGLPTGVSCSFSPASVTPTGTAAVTSTLTVTTTGATTAGLARPAFRPQTRWWLSGGATSLACLLLVGLPSRRRAASRWLAMLLFGLVVGGVMGCGSSGGGSKTNPDATPPGTYTVKLTATSGTGSGALNDPVAVTLTVTN